MYFVHIFVLSKLFYFTHRGVNLEFQGTGRLGGKEVVTIGNRNKPNISYSCETGVHTDWFNSILSILLLIFINLSEYETYVLAYTLMPYNKQKHSATTYVQA